MKSTTKRLSLIFVVMAAAAGLFTFSKLGARAMKDSKSVGPSNENSKGARADDKSQDRILVRDLVRPFEEDTDLKAEIIRGPRELAHITMIRAGVKDRDVLGKPVQTDVIFWVPGPPRARHHTKLLGAPYRPAAKPWPKLNQRDAVFLAQWYFGDSKDIVTDLPGDVLLMFIDAENFNTAFHGKRNSIVFEWQELGIAELDQRIVSGGKDFPTKEMHAVLCRSEEYPDLDSEDWEKFDSFGHGYFAGTTQASRIGGATWKIQGDEPSDKRRLIATLSSIWPRADVAYPFPMKEEPISTAEAEEFRVMFDDVGCISLYLDSSGKVHWEFDSY